MKLILTENQFSNLMSTKKAFFKYWDKFGPGINETILKLFSHSTSQHPYGNIGSVRSYLREWLGAENAFNQTKDLILKNPHNIGDDFKCGGYNFNFDLDIYDYRTDDDFSDILVNVTVHTSEPNAKVSLVMIGGEEYQLEDALNNEDYGWVIENEIQECIIDYFGEKITNKTGVGLTIYKLKNK